MYRHRATGSLTVTGPEVRKGSLLPGGAHPVASSNDPHDQLGTIFIESGKISREQLDESTAKMGPGNPLAKVLEESGFLTKRELGEGAREKVDDRILTDVLSWEAGSFEFEDGVLPKGAVDLRLSTERLLLRDATPPRPESRAASRWALHGAGAGVGSRGSARRGEGPEFWPLLGRLDGHRTLQEAIRLARAWKRSERPRPPARCCSWASCAEATRLQVRRLRQFSRHRQRRLPRRPGATCLVPPFWQRAAGLGRRASASATRTLARVRTESACKLRRPFSGRGL